MNWKMEVRGWTLGIAALLVFALFAVACQSSDEEPPPGTIHELGFANFQTAVASDRNYDVYWLGRSFEAGGLTYNGPSVNEFADEVEGGGLGMHYLAEYRGNCCQDLHLILYSDEAWDSIQARRNAGAAGTVRTKRVEVSGKVAELRTTLDTLTPIAGQTLVIKIDRTVVEAVTSARIPSTPSDPQSNPLIDEATFLAVLEQLRPYPD